MKYFLLGLSLLLVAPLSAGVYKYIDENGNVVFTDAPPAEQEIEEIVLPEVQTTNPYNAPRSLPRLSSTKKKSKNGSYKVSISPASGEAIRANGGVVSAAATIDPEPTFPVSTKFYLDGALVATSSGTSSSISGVDRGDHNIRVEVLNTESGAVIGSASSQVTILRASVIRR